MASTATDVTDVADQTDVTDEPQTSFDRERAEAFAETMFGFYTGGMVTYLVDIGHRTGLFDAAAEGRATSAGLAERADLHERYVREWLGAMVTAGVMTYEPEGTTYHLPAEHAASLTGATGDNVAPFAMLNTHLAKHVGDVTEAFRNGGGVEYSAFRPEFTDVMDELSRGGFDDALLDQWLDLVPQVRPRLRRGARVADIGCGTGHALILLAEAFPNSTFVGYDLAEGAIDRARAAADRRRLDNVRFEVADVAELSEHDAYDLVFVFDAIHDQVAPATVLANIHDALTDDGLLLMFEPAVSSSLEDNVAHPLAPFLYAISTLHCLTISLAHDGAGLGTAWGRQQACRMLREAGFTGITVQEIPDEPINALFAARA